MIFGTDYPVLPFKRTIEDIDALGLKPEVRRKLMRDNTIRIYGLKGLGQECSRSETPLLEICR